MRHLLTMLFLALSLGYTAVSFAQPTHYASVESLIQSQSVIRLYTDSGPNFGDQTANYNLIERLRALGFKGHFELIYSPKVTTKLQVLFDLPKELPATYEDHSRDITFITSDAYLEHYKNNTITPVELLITGANDDNLFNLICDHRADSICQTERPEAVIGKARVFVKLSNYVLSNTLSQGDERAIGIWAGDETKRRYLDTNSETFILTPVSTWEDAKNYLNNTPTGRLLTQQKPALQTLIEKVERQEVNFLPIYGAPFKTYKNEQTERMSFPNIILQTIAGARDAQLQGNNKPLVIAGFFDYDKELPIILHLIQTENNWGDYEIPGADHARDVIKQLALKNNFIVGTLSDPETITKLQHLTSNQILFISMGNLPKSVFDGLYTHTANNIWPQIREGASTFNAIIQTGKPHLRCGGDNANENWELGFDAITDSTLKTELQQFYSNYCVRIGAEDHWQLKGWENNNNSYLLLSHMLLEGNDPHSALSKYFLDLKNKTRDKQNDRIYQALDHAREILNGM